MKFGVWFEFCFFFSGIHTETYTYLNFLLRITDMITSRLPKTAATIIDIINDALNTVYEISNQSGSLTSPGKTVLDIAVAAASAETAAAEAKSNVVVVVVVSIA